MAKIDALDAVRHFPVRSRSTDRFCGLASVPVAGGATVAPAVEDFCHALHPNA
ncbi:MAG: hypothetical protein WBN68_21370 [Sedimenticolaceae bacterium]